MDQGWYFVVDIDGRGFVFDRVIDAASFMRDAAEHCKQGRYNAFRAEILMRAVTYDMLCELFPEDYKKEDDADETTTCTAADTTEG